MENSYQLCLDTQLIRVEKLKLKTLCLEYITKRELKKAKRL